VRDTHLIVALGDSITDGNRLSLTALHSWPEELSRRLAARGSSTDYAMVNAGIAGNRLLASGFGGIAALARLDRDALALDGITHLVVLEGTNDIGMSGHSSFGDNPAISAEEIIGGYRQIMARAHDRGVKVILGTILPFGGSASHDTPGHEQLREAVNTWIRTSREPDGMVDFDKALRDPAHPLQLRSDYDSGDHLHPNEAGSKAMGEAVDLSMFENLKILVKSIE
jgi:lysophospholipase L1-like esterase